MADTTLKLPSTGNPLVDVGLQIGLPLALDLIKWLRDRGTPEALLSAEQVAAIVIAQHKSNDAVQAKVAAALRGE